MSERTDKQWRAELTARDAVAISDLRRFLVRGIARGLGDRAGRDLAEDFAQEAMLKILDNLDSLRADGGLLAWCLAIGMRTAFSELRRSRWKDVSLDALAAPVREQITPTAGPERAGVDETKQRLMSTLRSLIDEELTPRQREAILAELQGIPQVVLAERLGVNRNALYKLSHDGRMKLKSGLQRAGFKENEVRSLLDDAS
ncbi:RNA polymerase sigma factor [bacterium]|jgi:RNA polymerase sigma-70 factor, ECF subfamily|nr:RNA polymerase sigma factor [bacterium]